MALKLHFSSTHAKPVLPSFNRNYDAYFHRRNRHSSIANNEPQMYNTLRSNFF